MVLVELKYSGPGTSVKLSNGDFRKLKDGIVFLAPVSDAFQLVKSESFKYNGKEEKKSVQVQSNVKEKAEGKDTPKPANSPPNQETGDEKEDTSKASKQSKTRTRRNK